MYFIYSNLTNNSKNIQKTSKCSKRTHKKRQVLFHRFLDGYTFYFLKKYQGKSGEQRKNAKFLGVMRFFDDDDGDDDFFILLYSLLAIMITDAGVTKSSLENLFMKVVVPATSKHWSHHTGLLVINFGFYLIASTRTNTIT